MNEQGWAFLPPKRAYHAHTVDISLTCVKLAVVVHGMCRVGCTWSLRWWGPMIE